MVGDIGFAIVWLTIPILLCTENLVDFSHKYGNIHLAELKPFYLNMRRNLVQKYVWLSSFMVLNIELE